MAIYRFPAQARLHTSEEFARAIQGNRIGRTLWFQLKVAPNLYLSNAAKMDADKTAQETLPRPRLGIAVSKRYAKRAVTRNAIKRVIREHFRLHQQDVAPGDYLVHLHTPIPKTLSLRQLKKEVHAQLLLLWVKVPHAPKTAEESNA